MYTSIKGNNGIKYVGNKGYAKMEQQELATSISIVFVVTCQ
jgi:hypothetical protein